MTQYDTVFIAQRVVLRSGLKSACVAVSHGRVAAVTPMDSPPSGRIIVRLAEDEVLIPGLVDSHVHLQNPGHSDWEDVGAATKAAVAGGVTTVVDMPVDSEPVTIDAASVIAKRQALSGRVFTDVGLWGGIVPGNVGRLGELVAEGVFGFKAFMVSPGLESFPPISLYDLRLALAELVPYHVPLLVHAEDESLALPYTDGGFAEFLASRPAEVEVAAVCAVVAAAEETGGRAHIVHVSAAGSLAVLEAARSRGVRVTGETCPHYLTDVADAKTTPPVRGSVDSEALWGGLAAGVLDQVVSDHSPCSPPGTSADFAESAPGVAAAHLRLPVTWTAMRQRGFGLTDLVRWCCSGPADLAGMHTKGRIVVGADADLVIFSPEQSFTVQPGARRTPYDGWTLAGVARRTWLHGVPTDDVARGRMLYRGAD